MILPIYHQQDPLPSQDELWTPMPLLIAPIPDLMNTGSTIELMSARVTDGGYSDDDSKNGRGLAMVECDRGFLG